LALLAPFDRPLALRLLGEVPRPRCAASPRVPPLGEPTEPTREGPLARSSPTEIARFLAHVLLTDTAAMRGVIAELEASVDENVVVWSPCVSTRSRTELVAALLEGDDAITDVAVSILGTSTSPGSPPNTTVYVEWRLEGRFNNAGFLNDDLLVEPSGATIEATGVIVTVFRHNRATHIRCYYDGVSLLEQVMR
jgi:ketosteroid isomerase-like protein